MLMTLFGFGAGAAGALTLATQGWLQPLGIARWSPAMLTSQPATPPSPPPPSTAAIAQTQGEMEARVAGLESKLDRLDMEAAAASGNAARAEALLVAFAARRVIERGAPLGYLEEQLKLRFGTAQPGAVATVVAAAHEPVTLDRLTAKLEALGPTLAKAPATQTGWERVKHELSDLFVVRRESINASPEPRLRLDHAKLCLKEGRVDDAIADIRLLPGAAVAQDWVAEAQRYATVLRALDVIETTALLEPKALRDGAGRPVEQESPVAGPRKDEVKKVPPAG